MRTNSTALTIADQLRCRRNFMQDEDMNAGKLSADRRSGCNRRSATDSRSKKEKGWQDERRSGGSNRRSGRDRRSEPRYEFEVE